MPAQYPMGKAWGALPEGQRRLIMASLLQTHRRESKYATFKAIGRTLGVTGSCVNLRLQALNMDWNGTLHRTKSIDFSRGVQEKHCPAKEPEVARLEAPVRMAEIRFQRNGSEVIVRVPEDRLLSLVLKD